jgi:PKD repeat protein
MVGEPYTLDLQIVVAESFDTVFQGRPATLRFKEIRIDSIRKIPRGLSINLYSGNAADNTQSGRTPIPGKLTPSGRPAQIFACGAIFGTPTEPTGLQDTMMIYVTADLDAYIGLPFPLPINNQPFSFPYPIVIKAPALMVDAGPDVELTCGESVILKARTNQSAVRYLWSPTTGLDDPTSPNPTAKPQITTTYTVRVTNGTETVEDQVTVKVLPANFALSFSASRTNFTSQPFTTTFTNQTPNADRFDFFWNFGDGNTSTSAGPVTHTYQQNGEYTVTLIAKLKGSECEDVLVKERYIICTGGASNLVVDAGADFSITCGESRSLRATCNLSQNVTFEWNPKEALDNPTILNPIASPLQTVTYTLVAKSGNLKAMDSVKVTVLPIPQPTISENAGVLTANVSGVGEVTQYSWYQNGNRIDGANAQTYQPTASGVFTVEIENEKGCRSVSEPFDFTITGRNAQLLDGHKIAVYPNPTTDWVTVQSTYSGVYSLEIVDLLGKTVYNRASGATYSILEQLDLSTLPSGAYYIQIKTAKGNKAVTKIVKE